jgi:hypothetical protein
MPNTFIFVWRVGVARIQHQAGHGEPEIVESAMKLPMVCDILAC